mmetsp:Transcript_33714/g.34341  ORF Transcript_33714/g.34341 Transcript_33714/m.34341 type:complete len:485 (+) Transcript_33714:39-1493(+)
MYGKNDQRSRRKIEGQSGVYSPLNISSGGERDKKRDSDKDKSNKASENEASGVPDYGAVTAPLSKYRNRSDGEYDEVNTDDDMYDNNSGQDDEHAWPFNNEEFGDIRNTVAYSSARTGRHRRKLAARTKGGEFQVSRRKRRLYFCCIGSEIDIQKLHDHINVTNGWDLKLYGDCLRLFRSGHESSSFMIPKKPESPNKSRQYGNQSMDEKDGAVSSASIGSGDKEKEKDHISTNLLQKLKLISKRGVGTGAQEVYIFEFGAAVLWGFPKGEETDLIDFIKEFVTEGLLDAHEFDSGEDDIGFVTSRDQEMITIANDVITMSENTVEKQRLAVSYAIAQSTILALFEARVETKVNEYKYIPETLAAKGQINLTHKQIGRMIGEIFVVRHDVNLHTVVLDTPDFFWKEEKYEVEYRMMTRYLEMSERVETVNKRLDMLKELLDVLEQQLESAHASKLEWIVIWLIVVEIVIEFIGIAGEVMGIWTL